MTRYTLESIRAQQAKLSADIKKRERRISRKWTDITTPPTFDSKFALYANRAEAAYNLYDGFMTGYKLLRICSKFFFKKKSEKTKKRKTS